MGPASIHVGQRSICIGRVRPGSVGLELPSYAVATGPVIVDMADRPRHAMSSTPPSTITAALRPSEPAAMRVHQGGAGAGAAGQREPGAPLPHAQPDAAGRQHLGEADVDPLREQGMRARAADRLGAASRGRSKNVTCGLPIEAAAGSPGRSRCSVSAGRASGMSCQPSRGGPISTRTRPSGIAAQHAGAGADAQLSGRSAAPWISRSATQRVALPHAPASPPSGLKIAHRARRHRRAAPITMNWSQPIPVCRSVKAAIRAAVNPGASRSTTDEIVAGAVHLVEGDAHAGAYSRGP